MGREKEPFRERKYSQDQGRRKHEEEYGEYEDDVEYDEDIEDDEYEDEERQDVYERGMNVPRRRSVDPLPPFPGTTRNIYPRTRRASRTSGPAQPTHSKRPTYLPQEPQQPAGRRSTEAYQQPSSRRSTGSYQRPPQRVTYTDTGDLPRRPDTARPVSSTPRRHRVWPIFLIGCISGVVSLVLAGAIVVLIAIHSVQSGGLNIPGIINTAKPFTQQTTQTVPLSFISQVIICDAAGNASLKVDPNISSPTVITTKTVHADSQANANQQLRQISVEVQPPNQLQKPLACQKPQATNTSTSSTNHNGAVSTATPAAVDNTVLTVNVTFPADQTGETVDVAITLPPSTVQSTTPTNTLISIEAPLGNITIDGVSGLMNIKGFSGNIIVQNAELVDGSHLTTEGNITFNGFLDIKDVTHTQPNQSIHYILSSGHQLDVTLPVANTDIILDANTNVGKIVSDFPIKAKNNGGTGAASYNGPLNSDAATDPNTTPLLTLDTSTGNIAIHKK